MTRLRSQRITHVFMNVAKRGMSVGPPLVSLVMKQGCQLGYLSLTTLQHHFERSEPKLHQENRLYEEITFVLAATKYNYSL